MNLCTVCGLDFGSVSAFDAHRVGKHDYLFGIDHADGRRCLTVEELCERSWTRDGRGRWRRPSDDAPWAHSENQVTREKRPNAKTKDLGDPRTGRAAKRLPDPETVASGSG